MPPSTPMKSEVDMMEIDDHTLLRPQSYRQGNLSGVSIPSPPAKNGAIGPETASPLPSLMFRTPQAVATIRVSGAEFVVHKQLLMRNSPYFERALNGVFAEAAAQEINLDDLSPVDFGFYVDIAYRSFFVEGFLLRKEHTGGRLSTRQILTFWQLADRFLNQSLTALARESLGHRLSLYSPAHWVQLYQRCSREDIESRVRRLQSAYNQCADGGMPFGEAIAQAAANCPAQVYSDCVAVMEPDFMALVSRLKIMSYADHSLNKRKPPPPDDRNAAG